MVSGFSTPCRSSLGRIFGAILFFMVLTISYFYNTHQDETLGTWNLFRTEYEEESKGNSFNGQRISTLESVFDFSQHPPSQVISRKRTNVSIVMGIPHIPRDTHNYLESMLQSVIDGMNEKEKETVLVVVMVAEIQNHDYVSKKLIQIQDRFKVAFESGLIEIIVPPETYYAKFLLDRHQKLGKYHKWKIKQNMDFAYLMQYCSQKGKYYLQLEDDIEAKPHFISTIEQVINKTPASKWMVLEFSSLGFIGKLFHQYDANLLAQYLLAFRMVSPPDWLYVLYLEAWICIPGYKYTFSCWISIHNARVKHKPALFHHMGRTSSLSGKIQLLKEVPYPAQYFLTLRDAFELYSSYFLLLLSFVLGLTIDSWVKMITIMCQCLAHMMRRLNRHKL